MAQRPAPACHHRCAGNRGRRHRQEQGRRGQRASRGSGPAAALAVGPAGSRAPFACRAVAQDGSEQHLPLPCRCRRGGRRADADRRHPVRAAAGKRWRQPAGLPGARQKGRGTRGRHAPAASWARGRCRRQARRRGRPAQDPRGSGARHPGPGQGPGEAGGRRQGARRARGEPGADRAPQQGRAGADERGFRRSRARRPERGHRRQAERAREDGGRGAGGSQAGVPAQRAGACRHQDRRRPSRPALRCHEDRRGGAAEGRRQVGRAGPGARQALSLRGTCSSSSKARASATAMPGACCSRWRSPT